LVPADRRDGRPPPARHAARGDLRGRGGWRAPAARALAQPALRLPDRGVLRRRPFEGGEAARWPARLRWDRSSAACPLPGGHRSRDCQHAEARARKARRRPPPLLREWDGGAAVRFRVAATDRDRAAESIERGCGAQVPGTRAPRRLSLLRDRNVSSRTEV